LRYLKNVANSWLNIAKHDEIMTKIQFTGTATQSEPETEIRQVNNDQYCM